MTQSRFRWIFPSSIAALTLLGVFWLPFLFPPAPLAGVSASNVAGFNNKVAVIVTGLLACLVFFGTLRRWTPDPELKLVDNQPLTRRFVAITALLVAAYFGFLGVLAARAQIRWSDMFYFIGQIAKHADYGRQLYTQIEFPYGPLLFYGPIITRTVLSPLHLSEMSAYVLTLVWEAACGALALAYVVQALPLSRRYKQVILLLGVATSAGLEIGPGLGLNFTFFRFGVPLALLVLAGKRRTFAGCIAAVVLGQMVSLALSPEMGFAFGAASFFYFVYQTWTLNRRWAVGLLAPFLATFAFLLLAGDGYLRMLQLFARGLLNVPVEPLPCVLIFLVAAVWLVPNLLGRCLREQRVATALLASLFVFAMALLPAAFGRADPAHIFLNGFAIYLLSMAAIAAYSTTIQRAWLACLVVVFFYTALYVNYYVVLKNIAIYDVLQAESRDLQQQQLAWMTRHVRRLAPAFSRAQQRHYATTHMAPFDLAALQQIVGDSSVATPYEIPPRDEAILKQAHQFVPTFYYYQVAVLDRSAEDRMITEFNQSQWVLLPQDTEVLVRETPESVGAYLGKQLPYHSKRPPYISGVRFIENLEAKWQQAGKIPGYVIYRRRPDPAHASGLTSDNEPKPAPVAVPNRDRAVDPVRRILAAVPAPSAAP